jgi:hypothetical protein
MDEPPRWWDLPPGTPRDEVIAAASRYDTWRLGEAMRVKREIKHLFRKRPRPYTIHPFTGVKTWSE